MAFLFTAGKNKYGIRHRKIFCCRRGMGRLVRPAVTEVAEISPSALATPVYTRPRALATVYRST